MAMHRAWSLISYNRNDDATFQDLSHRFRNLTGSEAAISHCHVYMPLYGQFDACIGLEWNGEQSTLIDAIGRIEEQSKPLDQHGEHLRSTTTYLTVRPEGSIQDCVAAANDCIPLCIGAYVKPREHHYVCEHLRKKLAEHKFEHFVVDMVLGEFDIFIVLWLAKSEIGRLHDVWSALRSTSRITKTVTMFTQDLIDHAVPPKTSRSYRARAVAPTPDVQIPARPRAAVRSPRRKPD